MALDGLTSRYSSLSIKGWRMRLQPQPETLVGSTTHAVVVTDVVCIHSFYCLCLVYALDDQQRIASRLFARSPSVRGPHPFSRSMESHVAKRCETACLR